MSVTGTAQDKIATGGGKNSLPLSEGRQSLLDRLTDGPAFIDRQLSSVGQLREIVLRDLSWLLNATPLDVTTDLRLYPRVARSVLNYGANILSGPSAHGVDADHLSQQISLALRRFEPRIVAGSVRVSVGSSTQNRIEVMIEGELRSPPPAQHVAMRIALDRETGAVRLSGPGAQDR